MSKALRLIRNAGVTVYETRKFVRGTVAELQRRGYPATRHAPLDLYLLPLPVHTHTEAPKTDGCEQDTIQAWANAVERELEGRRANAIYFPRFMNRYTIARDGESIDVSIAIVVDVDEHE